MRRRHANLLVKGWAAGATPPPEFTVSQWAEAHRHLPETSGARGGRWHNATTPYLVGIMDAVHEPGVKTIAVRKGAQIGGSEALSNILGYFIEHDPCPVLFVHPTVEVAEEWSKERLADMIRSTPALTTLLKDKRQRRGAHDAESTLTLKVFPGGFLALGGANTPNTFARRSVRLAIGDDVDRFPPVVGDEGDPADLLRNRTRTFTDAIVLFVSTPTLKGGRIDTLYERSDRRQFLLECPNCRRWDYLTWSHPEHFRVLYADGDATSARLACPGPELGGCGAQLEEPDRRAMVALGRWEATAIAQETGLVGFHLPSLVSTLGDVTLQTLTEQWLAARARGKESLRVFVNTTLAEGWEDRGARMEPHALLARREAYGSEEVEVPAGAALITAGVDVQEDRYALQVLGWGLAGERWVINWEEIPGDPRRADTQASLLAALSRVYRHASGRDLPIHATCLDTGYFTEDMYDFVLAHQSRRIFATKGFANRSGNPIVGKPSEKRYGKRPRPVRLWPINVDDAKADILTSLTLTAAGPNYCHFPAFVDEEYFAQLCAEHRETRYSRAGVATHSVWVKDRDRNEALDTAVLALAACRMYDRQIRQLLASLAPLTATTQKGQPIAPGSAQASAPTHTAAPRRQVHRSSYLGR